MVTRSRPASRPAAAGSSWDTVTLAPVVLVHGAEGLLVERAVQRLTALARAEQ